MDDLEDETLDTVCPSCGEPVAIDMIHCPACGTRILEESMTTPLAVAACAVVVIGVLMVII